MTGLTAPTLSPRALQSVNRPQAPDVHPVAL